jgi:hypothetical protein
MRHGLGEAQVFTRMSRREKIVSIAARKAMSDAVSATSAGKPACPLPGSLAMIARATASFSVPGRCVIATLAPALAKRSAVAAPMPPEPPMTSAAFPASEAGLIMACKLRFR